MSVTIKDKIKKLQSLSGKLVDEQARIVMRNKDKIINLNKNQFTDGYGSDDNDLINVNPRFSGIYSPGYKKQGLYDFYETGLFIRGMYIILSPDKLKLSIDSRGKGSGEKSLFFAGYTNLFGLDQINSRILNYEIIKPELMKFIKQNI